MQSATSQHVFLLLVLQLQGMLLFASGSNLLQLQSDLSLSEVCRAESKAELLENMQTLASETFREREEYTIDWMVKIPEGWEKADEIAERYGFINDGQVGEEEGTYNFILSEEEIVHMPRYVPYQNKTTSLMMEESVIFAEQKTVEIVCSKSNRMSRREKRQGSRATNLRVDWLSTSRVRVSWDHPVAGPPDSHYEFIQSSVIISGGSTTVTLRFLKLPPNDTSFTLSGVSRSSLNIFHLNAVYQSSVHSAIYLDGLASIPAPSNMTIETLNSTSMFVSWDPLPGQGYTYSAVVYDGGSILNRPTATSTSMLLTGLEHKKTYLVFAVAMSGNSYGVAYNLFKLEALRLAGGSHSCEGRVEVYHGRLWGTVCDHSWRMDDASVVCSHLSCGPATAAPRRAAFGQGDGPIWMNNVECTGREDFLEQCPSTQWGMNSCTHDEDAGVRCQEPVPKPTESPTTPPTSPTVVCPVLVLISNGHLNVNGFTPGLNATYSCSAGYRLDGNVIRTCQENGEWSGQEPFCVCNGNFCQARGTCPSLEPPENGQVALTSRIVGSIATYTCSPRFDLVGHPHRSCQSNSEWSGAAPTCQFICGSLSSPSNGQVTVTGPTATYTCNNGYQLTGDQTRTCQNTGMWSGMAPTCTRLCGGLTNPANGQATLAGRTSGSTATYTCNNGYQLTGVQTRTCQKTGMWSGMAPTCTRLCGGLPNPANGQVTLAGRTSGSTATYTCNNGYQLAGDQTRTCQNTGMWSGMAPTCTPLCPSLPDLENGEVIVRGSTANYSCVTVVGNALRRSRRVMCSAVLSSPANGRVTISGSTATYTCSTGYRLDGPQTRQCGNTREWSGVTPTCLIRCPGLNDPTNGQVEISGSSATYICSAGFEIDGDKMRDCQDSGEWTNVEPSCQLKCPELSVENGNVTVTDTTAVYECDAEYELTGADTRRCQDSGEWSGVAPTCTPTVTVSPPVNVKLAQESQTSLRVTWEHSCESPPDTHYSISYMFVQTGIAFSTRQDAITVDRMDTSTTITGLDLVPGSVHIVVVSSISDDVSAASELVQLAMSVPSQANVEATWQSSNTAQLSWDSPSGAQPTFYLIIHFSLDGRSSIDFTIGSSTSHDLSSLESDTYIVVLICYSSFTYTPYNPLKVTKAPAQDAGCMCPPTILSLVPGSSTTLNISWSHPCGGPPTTHYFITTMFVSTAPGFSQRQESSAILPPSTTSSVLNNLEFVSGNAYIFVVTAVSGPVSQSSAPMQFKIPHPSSLSPPTNVAANQLSPTSASISWSPPLQTPSFYFICYFPIELGGSAQFSFAFGAINAYDLTGLNKGGTYVIIVVSAVATTLSAADPVALAL